MQEFYIWLYVSGKQYIWGGEKVHLCTIPEFNENEEPFLSNFAEAVTTVISSQPHTCSFPTPKRFPDSQWSALPWDTAAHSSQMKLAVTALKFASYKGGKAFCISHGWLPHHLDICSQLSHWFSFLFARNKGILFVHSRVKAHRHSTCRRHAGLHWALNWKMPATSLQFWTVKNSGSQTFCWHWILGRLALGPPYKIFLSALNHTS